MSDKPAKQIMESLEEIRAFFRGEGGPMTFYVPDGKGGTTKRVARNVDEWMDFYETVPDPD